MKGSAKAATEQLLGTVLAVQANFYTVQLDQDQGEQGQGEKTIKNPPLSRTDVPPERLFPFSSVHAEHA